MTWMILGLVLFLGTHSLRIVANDWRSARLASMGEKPFKAVYGLVSIAGLALAIWGYGAMRQDPTMLWNPPVGLYHAVSLFTLPAFILLVAAYVPGNHLKARVGHPMVMAVKFWAFGHLLANGRVGDVVFFGAFFVWAVVLYIRSRKLDRAAGVSYPPGRMPATVATVLIGAAAWYLFARYGHMAVAGVPALPGG
jgi:uncharacterized membrane protein